MSLGATMACPYSYWRQCEAVDRRWGAQSRCIEQVGHVGSHVRMTERGNLIQWYTQDQLDAARARIRRTEEEGTK